MEVSQGRRRRRSSSELASFSISDALSSPDAPHRRSPTNSRRAETTPGSLSRGSSVRNIDPSSSGAHSSEDEDEDEGDNVLLHWSRGARRPSLATTEGGIVHRARSPSIDGTTTVLRREGSIMLSSLLGEDPNDTKKLVVPRISPTTTATAFSEGSVDDDISHWTRSSREERALGRTPSEDGYFDKPLISPRKKRGTDSIPEEDDEEDNGGLMRWTRNPQPQAKGSPSLAPGAPTTPRRTDSALLRSDSASAIVRPASDSGRWGRDSRILNREVSAPVLARSPVEGSLGGQSLTSLFSSPYTPGKAGAKGTSFYYIALRLICVSLCPIPLFIPLLSSLFCFCFLFSFSFSSSVSVSL
jgi:hypothetical protein